jgi:hypothetical protein
MPSLNSGWSSDRADPRLKKERRMGDQLTEIDATISACRGYRYRLWRRWGHGPTCIFVMLNPSTADATQDDPTIRRVTRFARREGCGSIAVVNLFAFRASSPAVMKAATDPIGPENDEHLVRTLQNATGPVIAAWGLHGSFRERDRAVRLLTNVQFSCLGRTKGGAPRHPLYVRADAPLGTF